MSLRLLNKTGMPVRIDLAYTGLECQYVSMENRLREHARTAIREAILKGQFRFGEKLSDRSLAERLGVSRTPVREALSRLAEDGLVVVRPQSGTTVMMPDTEMIRQCCETRALIEAGAVRIHGELGCASAVPVCTKILAEAKTALSDRDYSRLNELDTLFHEALVFETKNRFLINSYRAISDFITAIRYRLPPDHERYSLAFAQHCQIVEAMLSNRFSDAENDIRFHVTRVATMSTLA